MRRGPGGLGSEHEGVRSQGSDARRDDFDGVNNDAKTTILFESRRKGARAWQASSASYTEGPKVKWKTFAYCVKSSKLD